MFISKNKKTNGRYYLYYKDDNGKRKAVSTGTSFKNEALLYLIAFVNRINELNSPIPSLKPLKNFSDLGLKVTDYVANNLRKGTVKIYKNVLKNFTKILGDKPLKEISNKDIEYFKSCRLKKVTQSTVNIELNTLKAVFNIGIKFGWCVHNPVKGIMKLKIPEKGKLSMSDEEVLKLL